MKPKARKVFISANAFLAFIDRANAKHTQAVAYFQYLAQEKYQLYTGYNTVLDSHRALSEEISPSLARDFLRAITLSSINILYPTESDLKTAIKALTTSQSKDLTFQDAQMEALAYRNNIQQIFTFSYLPSLFGLSAFSLPV